jgi:hypothetical protein
VANYGGTLAVLNSTITGNAGNGVSNSGGDVTVINSTITGNPGGMSNDVGTFYVPGILRLARTLVAGNTASGGSEIVNFSIVEADKYNLFGVNGDAGVVGFTPGATDIIPPAGVMLPDILDPTLAFNGGPTLTHALVSGSPAIDAGGPMCLDANGDPLTTDQRSQPRPVDGNGDDTPTCDIGAFEFFLVDARSQRVSDRESSDETVTP